MRRAIKPSSPRAIPAGPAVRSAIAVGDGHSTSPGLRAGDLGSDEESASANDHVVFGEAREHLDLVADPASDLDRLRAEAAVAEGAEDEARAAGCEHCRLRHDQPFPSRAFELDIGVHLGPQRVVRIRELESDAQRAGRGVEDRLEERDAGLEDAAGEGRQPRRHVFPDHDIRCVRGVDVGLDPDRIEHGDAIEPLARFEGAAEDQVLFDQVAADRRAHRDPLARDSSSCQPFDLERVGVPETQAGSRGLDEGIGAIGRCRRVGLRLAAERFDVFLLGAEKRGAVDLEEGLAAFERLAEGVDVERGGEAADLERDVDESGFGDDDAAEGAHAAAE